MKDEQERYKRWIDKVGWFFFQLLVTGYVEDIESGECFQLPVGLEWKIYVEVCTIVSAISFVYAHTLIQVPSSDVQFDSLSDHQSSSDNESLSSEESLSDDQSSHNQSQVDDKLKSYPQPRDISSLPNLSLSYDQSALSHDQSILSYDQSPPCVQSLSSHDQSLSHDQPSARVQSLSHDQPSACVVQSLSHDQPSARVQSLSHGQPSARAVSHNLSLNQLSRMSDPHATLLRLEQLSRSHDHEELSSESDDKNDGDSDEESLSDPSDLPSDDDLLSDHGPLSDNESLSVLVKQFPVFAAYGRGRCINAAEQFDIDEDALIVYQYLRACDNGRINSLYVPSKNHYYYVNQCMASNYVHKIISFHKN